jgi:hypothetical protein
MFLNSNIIGDEVNHVILYFRNHVYQMGVTNLSDPSPKELNIK